MGWFKMHKMNMTSDHSEVSEFIAITWDLSDSTDPRYRVPLKVQSLCFSAALGGVDDVCSCCLYNPLLFLLCALVVLLLCCSVSIFSDSPGCQLTVGPNTSITSLLGVKGASLRLPELLYLDFV